MLLTKPSFYSLVFTGFLILLIMIIVFSNINRLNHLTPEKLYDLVKDFSMEKTKASKEEKKIASQTYEHPGGEIVFRGPEWTIAKVEDTGQLGKDAACFYGGNQL